MLHASQKNPSDDHVTDYLVSDDDSTEIKLATLASLSGCDDQALLFEALLSCDGVVEKACAVIRGTQQPPEKKRKASTLGYQSSLTSFGVASPSRPRKKQVTKRGQTLHLYSPEDIAAHTPCSIIHNFLRKDQANALLNELLTEAPTFGRETFKVFDNVVTSPHSMSFYVDDWNEAERQRNDYMYNGSRVTDIRTTPSEMRKVGRLVEQAVNEEIQKRIVSHYPGQQKLKYQSAERWTPNTSFVNCYDGGKESVGYHSDQLTYLGPRAIIGSLSLGVAREFRVRRIVPRKTQFDQDDDGARRANEERADIEGQISIHLPHNSLLVMHAEMQEEWKHAIAPAQAIDPHPLAGNKRLNITYRCYRSAFHPSKTPRCKCGVPTVLRCVQKQEQQRGRYFWQCVPSNYSKRPRLMDMTGHSGLTPGQDSCDFFEWAQFDDDGNPPWESSQHRKYDVEHPAS